MTFSGIVSPQAKKELAAMNEEDHIRCIADLGLLAMNPYPGYGGDKEKLKGYRNRYRIHIGRSYSAIYEIDKKK
jgi:mRNA-degrading endonuclease RelE of RelBE toxin-antitoxin system